MIFSCFQHNFENYTNLHLTAELHGSSWRKLFEHRSLLCCSFIQCHCSVSHFTSPETHLREGGEHWATGVAHNGMQHLQQLSQQAQSHHPPHCCIRPFHRVCRIHTQSYPSIHRRKPQSPYTKRVAHSCQISCHPHTDSHSHKSIQRSRKGAPIPAKSCGTQTAHFRGSGNRFPPRFIK